MQVLLSGESQTRHIQKVFCASGHTSMLITRGSLIEIIKNLYKVLKCDLVYQVYGRDIAKCYYLRFAAFLKKRIVIHWIGTDVLDATEQFKKSNCIMNQRFSHTDIVCAKHLQIELKDIGIYADYVPIFPPDIKCCAMPVPRSHAVMAYIPEKRESFYGINEVMALAERFSDIPFYIVANSGSHTLQKRENVHYMGMLGGEDLVDLYAKCSVLVRCTKHDGLPVMVLEALGFGRQVLYNHDFPCTFQPASSSVDDIIKMAEVIFSARPVVNLQGSQYVTANFTFEKLLEYYKEAGII